jgi:hypothetical protein
MPDGWESDVVQIKNVTANKDFIYASLNTYKNTEKQYKEAIREVPAENFDIPADHTEFKNFLAPYAVLIYKKCGILPSVTMVQGIWESGWGEHSIGFNLFGVKMQDDNVQIVPQISFTHTGHTYEAGPVLGSDNGTWAALIDDETGKHWYVYYKTMREAVEARIRKMTNPPYFGSSDGKTFDEQMAKIASVYAPGNIGYAAKVKDELYIPNKLSDYDPDGEKYGEIINSTSFNILLNNF